MSCLPQVWITVALRFVSNAAAVGGVDYLSVQSCLTLRVTLLDEVPCCPPSLPTLTLSSENAHLLSKTPIKLEGIHDTWGARA